MVVHRSFRCRFCGVVLPAWFPAQRRPDGAMLLHHLSRCHPAEVGHFLDQMHTTSDITRVAVQAFDAVEDRGGRGEEDDG